MKNGSQVPHWTELDSTELDFDLDGLNNSLERQLGTNPIDYDTDGDGLSDGEETQTGSEPLSVDSDGDGLTDLEERNLPPDIPTTAPDNFKLREAYYAVATGLLGWEKYPDCNWNTLYRELKGDAFTGKALDKEVLLTAMEKDIPPDRAILLIAQSPYVQWHRHNAQVSDPQVIEYLQQTYTEAELQRRQQAELFGRIQGESSVDIEIERQN